MLSIIVFGIPHTTKDSDIYSVIYSAKSSDHIVPEWFLGTLANNADHKLLKEEAMSIDGERKHSVNETAPTATRRRQYSYGSVEEHKEEHKKQRNEAIYGAKGVFYNAFNGCQALGYLRIPLIDDFHSYKPMIECERERQKVVGMAKQQFSTSDYKKMDLIVRRDPLTPLSGEDKYFMQYTLNRH